MDRSVLGVSLNYKGNWRSGCARENDVILWTARKTFTVGAFQSLFKKIFDWNFYTRVVPIDDDIVYQW